LPDDVAERRRLPIECLILSGGASIGRWIAGWIGNLTRPPATLPYEGRAKVTIPAVGDARDLAPLSS